MKNIFNNLTNIYGGDQSYYIQKLENQKEMYEKKFIEQELSYTKEINHLKLQLVSSQAERDIAKKDKEIAELKLQLLLK